MIEIIEDRPLLSQIYDWLHFLNKIQNGRDFSKSILGRCPGYLTAWRTMRFNPGPKPLISARSAIVEFAEKEPHPGRHQVFKELVAAIDSHLLGKGGAA